MLTSSISSSSPLTSSNKTLSSMSSPVSSLIFAALQQLHRHIHLSCNYYQSSLNTSIPTRCLLFVLLHQIIRAAKQLISLIMLIAQLNFFNRALIVVLMHILFVTFYNLFVFHLQADVVGPLLLNAGLLLVVTTH